MQIAVKAPSAEVARARRTLERLRRRTSTVQVAADTGIHQSQVSRLLRGHFRRISANVRALLAYAAGDGASKPALTDTFVQDFAAVARVNNAPVTVQVNATIKVIDAQRAKSSKTLAAADRAAATAMQPIADSAVER